MKERVLLVAIDREMKRKISAAVLPLKIARTEVLPSCYDLSIREILDHPNLSAEASEPAISVEKSPEAATRNPRQPLIILCGLSDSRLDRLLAALRKQKTQNLLKAVLTPVNIDWTVRALYNEVQKEHEIMSGQAGNSSAAQRSEGSR